MPELPPPDDAEDVALDADEVAQEHRALKKQIAELRREHDRLHEMGGTQAEHRAHIENLRGKIRELEQHVMHLRGLRVPRGR